MPCVQIHTTIVILTYHAHSILAYTLQNRQQLECDLEEYLEMVYLTEMVLVGVMISMMFEMKNGRMMKTHFPTVMMLFGLSYWYSSFFMG